MGGEGGYERWLRIYSPCLVVLDAPSNLRDHEQEAAAGSGETAVVKRSRAVRGARRDACLQSFGRETHMNDM